MQKRQPVREDKRKPIDTQAKGLAATKPKVNEHRDDIYQVKSYDPGHKGQQQKRRKSWPY
jgi:hypothetical protein